MYYRDSLTSEVLRLSAVVQPDISRETMESVAKSMSVVQLKEFKNAFEKYTMNQSKMLRYADRRRKKEELSPFIKTISNLWQ